MSFTRVGVLGAGEGLREAAAEPGCDEVLIPQTRGVSGVTVSSETSRL